MVVQATKTTRRRGRQRDPHPAPGSYSYITATRIARVVGLTPSGADHLIRRAKLYPVATARTGSNRFIRLYDELEVMRRLYTMRAIPAPQPRRCAPPITPRYLGDLLWTSTKSRRSYGAR